MDPSRPSWWSRNRRRLALGVLVACVVVAGAAAAGFHALTSPVRALPPYADAVARALASDALRARLGEPVAERWWLAGRTNIVCGKRSVSMTIPFSGPRGTARVKAYAVEFDGQWRMSELALLGATADAPVDLLTDAERAHLAAWRAENERWRDTLDDAAHAAARARAAADGRTGVCPDDYED